MNTKLGFTATLLTVGLLTAPVLAADEDYNAFNQAKTSLTQAIPGLFSCTRGKTPGNDICIVSSCSRISLNLNS